VTNAPTASGSCQRRPPVMLGFSPAFCAKPPDVAQLLFVRGVESSCLRGRDFAPIAPVTSIIRISQRVFASWFVHHCADPAEEWIVGHVTCRWPMEIRDGPGARDPWLAETPDLLGRVRCGHIRACGKLLWKRVDLARRFSWRNNRGHIRHKPSRTQAHRPRRSDRSGRPRPGPTQIRGVV